MTDLCCCDGPVEEELGPDRPHGRRLRLVRGGRLQGLRVGCMGAPPVTAAEQGGALVALLLEDLGALGKDAFLKVKKHCIPNYK